MEEIEKAYLFQIEQNKFFMNSSQNIHIRKSELGDDLEKNVKQFLDNRKIRYLIEEFAFLNFTTIQIRDITVFINE